MPFPSHGYLWKVGVEGEVVEAEVERPVQLALVDQRGTNLSRSQHQQTISEGTIRLWGRVHY